MKTVIKVPKGLILFVFLTVSMAFCKKNDLPNDGANKGAIDYHQTAVTQFVTADETKFAYRVLGNKNGTPLIMLASLGSSMDEWDPAVTNGLAQHNVGIPLDGAR